MNRRTNTAVVLAGALLLLTCGCVDLSSIKGKVGVSQESPGYVAVADVFDASAVPDASLLPDEAELPGFPDVDLSSL